MGEGDNLGRPTETVVPLVKTELLLNETTSSTIGVICWVVYTEVVQTDILFYLPLPVDNPSTTSPGVCRSGHE